METCQGCLKDFPSNVILRHIGKIKACKRAYGSTYEDLRKEKILESKRTYRIKNATSIKEKKRRTISDGSLTYNKA